MKRSSSLAAWLMLSLVLALSFLVTTGHARGPVRVEIGRTAPLLQDGQVVEVTVTVACQPQRAVLEALVYVTQDGNQSQFAGIPVQCTGRPNEYKVQVRAYDDSPFHRGDAYASAYILVQHQLTGATNSGQAAQALTIQ